MTSQHRPLGVQIAHMLKARGVDHVFGIPGVHNIEMYRGIDEAGLTHILARHEQGAGFMADGYARASGKAGVAFVISGPGVLNALTPMGQAYSDSVPMLVVSSCLDPQDVGVGKGKLHEMRDQEGAAATVSDWSETALDANGAYHLIDRALTEFETRRPRTKHMQVPIAVLGAMAPPPPQRAEHVHPVPDLARVAADVAARIGAARKPLFVIGGGARRAGGLTALLAQAGAACFLTYAGRGCVDPAYPLNFGSFLARPDSAEVIAEADLVIALGTELAEVDLWRDALGHQGALVRVDIDPVVLRDDHVADLAVLADAAAFVGAVAAALPERAGDGDWRASEVARHRARWRAAVQAERPGVTEVADALRAVLAPDTLIYSDMTQFAYGAKEVWDMPAAGLWHHPYGFGTLGYALPAAIGGKVAAGDAPVMAIAGDYGLQYTLPELATAVELEMCLPIIVWDNNGLGEIEASMARSQIAPVAVSVRNPDFVKLAEAYGAVGVQPESLEAMQAAVVAAFARQGPTIIRVVAGLV